MPGTYDDYSYEPPAPSPVASAPTLPVRVAEGGFFGDDDPQRAEMQRQNDQAQREFERYGGNPRAAAPTALFPRPEITTLADGAAVVTDPWTGQQFVRQPGQTHFTAPDARGAMSTPAGGAFQGDMVGWLRALARNAAPGTDARRQLAQFYGVGDPLEGLSIAYAPQAPAGAQAAAPDPNTTGALRTEAEFRAWQSAQGAQAPSPEGSPDAEANRRAYQSAANAAAMAARLTPPPSRHGLAGGVQQAIAAGAGPAEANGQGDVLRPEAAAGEAVALGANGQPSGRPWQAVVAAANPSGPAAQFGVEGEDFQYIDDRRDTIQTRDGRLMRWAGDRWVQII